jgi:hypothetical protein
MTTDCPPIAPSCELGAVGEFSWLHDAKVKAATAVTMKGTINRGDVNDIGSSLKFFTLVGFPSILRQKVNHDLRPDAARFQALPNRNWQVRGDFGWAKRAKRKGIARVRAFH